MLNLIGYSYERLSVIEDVGTNGKTRLWKCKCSCGNIKVFSSSILKAKRIKSCGCLHKERMKLLNRLPDGLASKRRIYKSYENGAKRRGLDFLITFKEFENIIQKNCHYCGIIPSNSSKTINPHGCSHISYNGMDRKNNKLGYTIDNILPCCNHCNYAKFDFTYEEFINYLNRLILFRNKI